MSLGFFVSCSDEEDEVDAYTINNDEYDYIYTATGTVTYEGETYTLSWGQLEYEKPANTNHTDYYLMFGDADGEFFASAELRNEGSGVILIDSYYIDSLTVSGDIEGDTFTISGKFDDDDETAFSGITFTKK